jgi:hypothetical protein
MRRSTPAKDFIQFSLSIIFTEKNIGKSSILAFLLLLVLEHQQEFWIVAMLVTEENVMFCQFLHFNHFAPFVSLLTVWRKILIKSYDTIKVESLNDLMLLQMEFWYSIPILNLSFEQYIFSSFFVEHAWMHFLTLISFNGC